MHTVVRIMFLPILFGLELTACTDQAQPLNVGHERPDPTDFDAPALWGDIRDDFDLFYAYRDDRGFDANRYLDRVGALVSNASDRPEFRRQLHRATYVFTDLHLGFGPADDSDFNIIPTSSYLQIDHRAGLYYISDVRADSAAYEASIRLGWTLETVNGQPIYDQSLAVFSGLVDTPTDAQLDYSGTLLANVRRVGERQLSFSMPQARRDPPSNPRQSERAGPSRHVTSRRRDAAYLFTAG